LREIANAQVNTAITQVASALQDELGISDTDKGNNDNNNNDTTIVDDTLKHSLYGRGRAQVSDTNPKGTGQGDSNDRTGTCVSNPYVLNPCVSNNPVTGGTLSENEPEKIISTENEPQEKIISNTFDDRKLIHDDKKLIAKNNPEPAETMYTIPDRTMKNAFEKKLKGAMNLNEELALVRTFIQQIVKKMNSDNLSAEELNKLDKLLGKADMILNTIHRIESTRSVQYTRESLKMDVMKVVGVIRRLVPEDDRRRKIATELARALGPSLADTGDIIVSRETFKRGGA
jgi:hypothetical protein